VNGKEGLTVNVQQMHGVDVAEKEAVVGVKNRQGRFFQ
jgi:hypothetical protein